MSESCKTLPTLGTTTFQNPAPGFRGHPHEKSVSSSTVSTVWLERAL
ncbi:uncharacterized protein METZ01_LOCUS45315, partial [marine metagenome]